MRLRRLWPAAVLVLAPVLAACGDDGDPDTEPTPSATPTSEAATPTPSETPTSSAMTPTTTPPTVEPTTAGRPPACDLLTDGDVSKALGETVAAGKATGADTCTFTGSTVTVKVSVSGPGACTQPADTDGNVEPSDVAGAKTSWWKTSSAPPLVALQRACAKDAKVDVALTYSTPSYEGDPSAGSAQLAGLVLASLQG